MFGSDRRPPDASALILVAEEEKGWALPLVGALRQHGYVARVQTRPEAARAALAERPYRLLVLGSGVDAAAFARALRRSTSTSRRAWVLAVCPDAGTARVLGLRDAGVSAVLIAPVTLARLQERLQAMAR